MANLHSFFLRSPEGGNGFSNQQTGFHLVGVYWANRAGLDLLFLTPEGGLNLITNRQGAISSASTESPGPGLEAWLGVHITFGSGLFFLPIGTGPKVWNKKANRQTKNSKQLAQERNLPGT